MVMAEWIEDYDGDYYCSECGHYLEPYELLPHLIVPSECPDCRAKMINPHLDELSEKITVG